MRYLVALAFVVLVGCDALTSTSTGVGVVTRTPDLAAASGMDQNLVTYLPIESVAKRNATVGVVILGNRASATSSNFSQTTGANVTLSFSGQSVDLCDNNNGTYSGTSVAGAACADTALRYQPNAEYTFDAVTASDSFSMRVTAPVSMQPSAVTFTPALSAPTTFNGAVLQNHPRNTALEVNWENADAPAFVTVFRVNYVGTNNALSPQSWQADTSNPVFSNLPQSANDYVAIITGNQESTLTIPASAFSGRALYFVVVTLLEVSTETSGLSIGSGAIAGAGTAFTFFVP